MAGGPISWGVCEVPGWGPQLPPERVLDEMRSLGLRLVEAGPVGYLGTSAAAVRSLLGRHGLAFVGGFFPAVLHEPAARERTLRSARTTAELYAQAGGSVLVSACVVDEAWSPPTPLDAPAWDALLDGLVRLDEIAAAAGLVHVLHPHVGTLVEARSDVARVLAESAVRLCLDTGHVALGGADPVALVRDGAERIAHVHLKDVRRSVAAELRAGRLTLVEATRQGLFCPLGDGDVPIAETVRALERAGYAGLYVLEQDTALTHEAPPAPGQGPVDDTRRSIEFLRSVMGTGRQASRKEAFA